MTEADKRLLQAALNHAMDERASYAEAWNNIGPEARRALKAVRDYERLHVKMFGTPSARQHFIDKYAAMPTVSIHEIHKTQERP